MARILMLASFLGEVAGRGFAYGTFDCAVLMADWLSRRGWPDPMQDRRGTYATEREFRAAVRSEGGLLAACRRRFGRLGLCETERPQAGDVALVLVPFVVRRGRMLCRPTGAIVLDNGLVAVATSPRGIAAARLPVIVSWSVSRA